MRPPAIDPALIEAIARAAAEAEMDRLLADPGLDPLLARLVALCRGALIDNAVATVLADRARCHADDRDDTGASPPLH